MVYTEKIRSAVKFAIKTHDVYQKQKRKGKDIAYISHPLTVGIILSRAGAEEDVVVAGILHDTIEDSVQEKKVTKKMLRDRFGAEVAELVGSVTEEDKKLSWERRKKTALRHIQDFSHASLLVKSADIVSNASELVDDFRRHGDEVFSRFNAPKEKFMENHMQVISSLVEKWRDNPLRDDLLNIHAELKKLG